jgi:N-acetylglucosaminyldiphosphoundecaprenol N-acetyl-beta-D-mannosaminyltransferase
MILNKLLTDQREVINKVTDSIDGQQSLLLTYLNQHCFNIYNSNKEYRKLLDTQFTIYQADHGMFLALKYLFGKKINKIDATAMNQIILNELIKKKISLIIIGGNFDKKFGQEKCSKEKINLVGYQKGYFEENQTDRIIKDLNELNTNVFIIGMGVPKQELFAEKLSQGSNNKVVICVGIFFEFYFGTKKRAPLFIQKIGFEWMFRLFTEPRRLWNRYLIGIPLFLYRILKVKFTKKSL